MNRKVFCIALCAMLFPLCLPVEARPGKKLVRIGYLGNASPPAEATREEAFLQGLREHGWIESQNIVIERRYWENRAERLPALADEFVRLKVDIIVTSTGTAALAAKKATGTIPIVMTSSGDAVTQGIVASLARPGGNVTGLTSISSDVTGKQLELLKEAFPKVSRVAFLRCPPTTPAVDVFWSEAQIAGKVLKVHVLPLEVNGPEEIEGALRAATRERADGLFVSNCPRIPSSKTAELVAKSRLPAIYAVNRFTEAGGLMSYAASVTDLSRQAATYVDKILKGTKPADLPVQQPTKFELVLNLKTAKQIGLTIPPNVLARADRVIR
jgi:putative tryptophan/tyrosine transport system substrate-binding protein